MPQNCMKQFDIVAKLNMEHTLIGTSHLPLVWQRIIDEKGEYFFDHVSERRPATTSTKSPPSNSDSATFSGCTNSYCGPRTRSGRIRHDELKKKIIINWKLLFVFILLLCRHIIPYLFTYKLKLIL